MTPEERDLAEIQQMCDAPSDAFSAGEWCFAANILVRELRAESAARERAARDNERLDANLRHQCREAERYAKRAENAERERASVRSQHHQVVELLHQHIARVEGERDGAVKALEALSPYVRHRVLDRSDGTYGECHAVYGEDGDCECGAGKAIKKARSALARIRQPDPATDPPLPDYPEGVQP